MAPASSRKLQRHAHELAAAFDVRLIESGQLKPEEALGLVHIRVALCALIGDETTYAVALHEIGHLVSPSGAVRQHVAAKDARERSNLMIFEEEAAWAWARHNALEWTPLMESVASYALGTYGVVVDPPPAPAPARPSINWNDYK